MKTPGVLFLILSTFHAAPVQLAAQRHPKDDAKALIAELLSTYPGISVAVGRNNEIIWSEGFGFANIDQQTPVVPSTAFRYYSLSKSITGMALAKLSATNQINIDNPVTDYLQDLPSQYKQVKISHLISHSAGVRHYKKGEWMAVSKSECTNARQALAPFINDPLEFTPGTKYQYSSFGYVLLSALIEQVTGKAYVEYLQAEIFAPAGVDGIFPARAPYESVCYEKWDAKKSRGKIADQVNNSCKFGGGALVGNATALVQLHMAMLDGKIVQGTDLERYYTSFTDNDGKPLNYGFGVGVMEREGEKYCSHSGSAVGANCVLIIFPEKKLVFVILGNLDDNTMNSFAGKIARLFL